MRIYPTLLLVLLLPISVTATDVDQILMDAINHGDTAAIADAIQRGANVNTDGTGLKPQLPPLIFAIQVNKPDSVDILLRAGADPNLVQHNQYPLYSATNADTRILKLLLGAKANPNIATPLGDTPLHSAASCRRQTYVDLSKSGGYRGNFPDCEMGIRLLLNAGAAIDVPGFGGKTPLMDAVFWNNVGSAKLLLAAGANTEAKDQEGRTALMLALDNYALEEYARLKKRDYIKGQALPMIQLLLEHRANPNIRDAGMYDVYHDATRTPYSTGYTPLT